MRLFPVNLVLKGKTAVVVGGGEVAARKTRSLIDAGAVVTVVSPALEAGLAEAAAAGRIRHISRRYHAGDLEGAAIAFAAADDPRVNLEVAGEASRLGIPVNVADDPSRSSFISPAVVRRGELLLTVSTSGAAPLLAVAIRNELAERYGEGYAEVVEALGKAREKLLTRRKNGAYNGKLFHELTAQDLQRMLRENSIEELINLLTDTLPEGEEKERR